MFFLICSGMDVLAKRQVWKIIRREVASGRSVILTSHSMEECEDLCTRLAIMAGGRFQCLGTPSRIKEKWVDVSSNSYDVSRFFFSRLYRLHPFFTCRYGHGYTLQFAFSSPAQLAVGMQFLTSHFSDLKNLKQHLTTLTCRAPSEKLSVILGLVLNNKDNLGIIDFSIKQTSLDEVRSSELLAFFYRHGVNLQLAFISFRFLSISPKETTTSQFSALSMRPFLPRKTR